MEHKTMITAHTGSHGTGHNSQKFLDSIEPNGYEAMEVDVRRRCGRYYIAHNLPFCAKKRIPLREVLELVKRLDIRINLDLKEQLMIPIQELVKEMGVEKNVLYTGCCRLSSLPKIEVGDVYINVETIRRRYGIDATVGNLEKIKKLIDDMANPRIKGINLSYTKTSDEFIDEAQRVGLALSIYTVNKPEVYERLLRRGVDNITSMVPRDVMELRAKIEAEAQQ